MEIFLLGALIGASTTAIEYSDVCVRVKQCAEFLHPLKFSHCDTQGENATVGKIEARK